MCLFCHSVSECVDDAKARQRQVEKECKRTNTIAFRQCLSRGREREKTEKAEKTCECTSRYNVLPSCLLMVLSVGLNGPWVRTERASEGEQTQHTSDKTITFWGEERKERAY